MKPLQVKIKRLNENAVIPAYAHPTDAGLDLTATSKKIEDNGIVTYGTGIAVEIPKGYVGLIFPRSSNCKKELLLSNSVGVIDSCFRGEIMLKYAPTTKIAHPERLIDRLRYFFYGTQCGKHINLNFIITIMRDSKREYEIGDRVGQLIIMPYPKVQFKEVTELSDSERGNGGYGSTGK